MKTITLTDEELRTLIWAVDVQFHRTMRLNVERGKPMKDETTARLVSISSKAYNKLVGAKEIPHE